MRFALVRLERFCQKTDMVPLHLSALSFHSSVKVGFTSSVLSDNCLCMLHQSAQFLVKMNAPLVPEGTIDFELELPSRALSPALFATSGKHKCCFATSSLFFLHTALVAICSSRYTFAPAPALLPAPGVHMTNCVMWCPQFWLPWKWRTAPWPV